MVVLSSWMSPCQVLYSPSLRKMLCVVAESVKRRVTLLVGVPTSIARRMRNSPVPLTTTSFELPSAWLSSMRRMPSVTFVWPE